MSHEIWIGIVCFLIWPTGALIRARHLSRKERALSWLRREIESISDKKARDVLQNGWVTINGKPQTVWMWIADLKQEINEIRGEH